MKKKNHFLVFVLIVLCACFTACQMENPIMETWWQEQEAAVIEREVVVDREVIIERETNPQEIFQSITIIDIQYIIFAGGSSTFNGPPSSPTGTDIPDFRQANIRIKDGAALLLRNNPNYRVFFHGHANPVDRSPDEIAELMELSRNRAVSVEEQVRDEFVRSGGNADNFNTRSRTAGYGGNLTITNETNHVHLDLNRRVEIIIFTIDTQRQ